MEEKHIEETTETITSNIEAIDNSSSRGQSAPHPFNKSIADMEEERQQPTLTIRDFKALKRARYDKIAEKFQYAYLLRNKKTGLIVQIQAASSIHACNIIGWKPNHAQLLEVIDTKKKEEAEKVAEVAEVKV